MKLFFCRQILRNGGSIELKISESNIFECPIFVATIIWTFMDLYVHVVSSKNISFLFWSYSLIVHGFCKEESALDLKC